MRTHQIHAREVAQRLHERVLEIRYVNTTLECVEELSRENNKEYQRSIRINITHPSSGIRCSEKWKLETNIYGEIGEWRTHAIDAVSNHLHAIHVVQGDDLAAAAGPTRNSGFILISLVLLFLFTTHDLLLASLGRFSWTSWI